MATHLAGRGPRPTRRRGGGSWAATAGVAAVAAAAAGTAVWALAEANWLAAPAFAEALRCRSPRRRWRTACQVAFGQGIWGNEAVRYTYDNYAKWDPKGRKQTGSPEEAERILINTGRMPRPLRLRDVKANAAPMQKSIVANAEERRKAAEMVNIYSVNKMQAKMLITREAHRVWGHDRILVYANIFVNYIMPDAKTCEPLEVDLPLKFKVAFREDNDPFFPTRETRWNDELERRGLRPDIMEGKKIEALLKGANPSDDIAENVFCEAILDNVIDLGELVLQHFACHIDPEASGTKKHRLNQRLQRRMRKELGVNVTCSIKELENPPGYKPPTAQELHDHGSMPEWHSVVHYPKSNSVH